MNLLNELWTRARQEVAVLAVLCGSALAALSFAYVAGETREGGLQRVDETWLLMLREASDRSNPIGPRWFELAVADVTSLGGFAVLTLLVIAISLYLVATGKRAAALLVFCATVSGAILSEVLKFEYARPRPDLVSHLVEVQSGSFPSGHAMLSAITYLTLGALLARFHERRAAKALLLSLGVATTLMVGGSRVYLGVHWPTDVLAGWSLGAAWAALWWLGAIVVERMQVRKSVGLRWLSENKDQ